MYSVDLKMNVVSSNIKTADYDRVKRELTMTFINRPRWVYVFSKIPPNIWKEFVRASSKGEYFSAVIRDKYNYTRTIIKK